MIPLFARVLGDRFAQLPPAVSELHAATHDRTWYGEAEVVRGHGWIAHACALAARLPPSASCVPVRVHIRQHAAGEIWCREFGRARMPSRLGFARGRLRERLGMMRFDFNLRIEHGRLEWRVAAARALGLPLPARWFARVRAAEFEQDGRYCFEIDAVLPCVGRVVRYAGWLDVRIADK